MTRYAYLILLVLLSKAGIGQTTGFFLVNLAIEDKSILNQGQNSNTKDLLFKKLTLLCNNTEGLIIDGSADYYLVSDIYSTKSQTSNAGFLPVGQHKMNLKLSLRYKTNGTTFKELNFSKDYLVNTELEAAQSLVEDFSFSTYELNTFFTEGAKKMQRFYIDNCSFLIKSAKKYQSIGEAEKALAICLNIPADVPCSKDIAPLTKGLYTALSYKSDYSIFLRAQDLVSKGNYENAFKNLDEISIYSQFFTKAQTLSKQINDFIFNQKQLQKKKELAESELNLKEAEIELQQKRNELQANINQTNLEIANSKLESDRQIALGRFENEKQIKAMEFQSQERKEMIKTAGGLLNSYINRPQPTRNTSFYIIK